MNYKDIDILIPDSISTYGRKIEDIIDSEGNIRFNRIYLGDCLEILQKLPDECVQLIVTSPPYNIGRGKEKRVKFEKYMVFQEKVIKECYRVLRKTGSIFWEAGSYTEKGAIYPLDIKYFSIFENLKMVPRNRIIWTKTHGVHSKKKFSCRHEAMLWFTKTDNYLFNLDPIRIPQLWPNKKAYSGPNKGKRSAHPKGKNPGDVWDFEQVKWNHPEQTLHPAQFPEKLVERVIKATTTEEPPYDVVLDHYMGSGTTALVAKQLKRRFLGAEIVEKYWKVAMLRLAGVPDKNGNFVNLKQYRKYGSSRPNYGYHMRPKMPVYPEKQRGLDDILEK